MPYLEKITIIMSMMALTFGSIRRSYGEFMPEERNCCPRDQVDWSLNLTAVGINRLSDGFVANKFLTHLILDGNQIQEITEDAFSSMPSLTYLSLANNQLRTFDLLPFSRMKNLKTLILSGNPEYYRQTYDYGIPFDLSDRWLIPSITHLYAENCNVRYSSFDAYVLTSLTHLHMSYNPNMWHTEHTLSLKSFAPNITHLYAKGCGIEILDLSELSTVTSLYLDENAISIICNDNCPGLVLGIEAAERLITLSVSHNRISDIEADVFRYTTNLVTLDLSYNQILRLKEGTFDMLQLLETLNLDNNFNLGLNAIETIKNLPNLKNLSLQNTNISDIHSTYFKNFSTLNKLVLSYNQIFSIESGSFSELANLKELYLAGNQLWSIPHDCLPNSGSLLHLQLDDNMFTNMENIHLANAPNILHLCVRNNPLTIATISWFKNAPDNLTIFWGDTCPQL